MRVLYSLKHKRIYIAQQLRLDGVFYRVLGLYHMHWGEIRFLESFTLLSRNFVDVSEFFVDPENITLKEFELFAMIYPDSKLFSIKTGQIYESYNYQDI